MDGHSSETIPLLHAVLQTQLEFILAEGTPRYPLQLLVTEGLRENYLDVTVELCLFPDLLPESDDIVSDVVFDVDGDFDVVLPGELDWHEVQVEFLVELLRGVGEVHPALGVSDVEVYLHDVIVLLIEGLHSVRVE